MHGNGLLESVLTKRVASGDEVDCQGFEGVLFIADAAGSVDVTGGDTSGSLTSLQDGVTVVPGGSIQVHKPRGRYVAFSAGGATVRYGSRTRPANAPTDVNIISPTPA